MTHILSKNMHTLLLYKQDGCVEEYVNPHPANTATTWKARAVEKMLSN